MSLPRIELPPLAVLEGSPGNAVLDLHNTWFGVARAFGEERDRLARHEGLERAMEEHEILALAVDEDAARAKQDPLQDRVREERRLRRSSGSAGVGMTMLERACYEHTALEHREYETQHSTAGLSIML